MMKVLLLTTHLDIGGISKYTIWLAEGLKKIGYQVIVASNGGELALELEEKNIPHFKIDVRTKSEINPLLFKTTRTLRDLVRTEKIDVIHAQTRIAQLLAYYVAKSTGIPYVTTFHGLYKRRLSRKIIPCWGDRAIAISEPVRAHLVNHFKVPKERVQLIHNGLDFDKFSRQYSPAEIKDFKTQYGLREKGEIVGNLARLVEVKGQEYLIQAAAEILKVRPRTQFLIIGDGKDKNKLMNLAEKLNITASVFFTGSLREVDIALAAMDIFAFPAFWQEGFGLSILEAMAKGLPVVASNVGGIYTLVKDNKSGFLIPPKDVASLIQAILRLLDDKKLAAQMGKAGRQLAIERFSLDKVVSQVKDVYREVSGS